MDAGQIILAIIGIGIIVVGVMILMTLKAKQPNKGGEIIVREDIPVQPWGTWAPAWWNGAPYYSHVPMRPLLY
jgi:hypothetical protein